MWTPAAIAALLTMTQEFPVLEQRAISDANRRNCLPSSARPPERERTPVPNLITIRAIEQLVDSRGFPCASLQRSLSA